MNHRHLSYIAKPRAHLAFLSQSPAVSSVLTSVPKHAWDMYGPPCQDLCVQQLFGVREHCPAAPLFSTTEVTGCKAMEEQATLLPDSGCLDEKNLVIVSCT